VRIPIPGSNGLYLELAPRGWVPQGGSTSTVFLQSADGGTHLRLDYGFNTRTNTFDYHWNQKGTFREFGISDHTSVPELEGLYKGAKAFKYAGRTLLVVGIALDVISIWQAEDKLQETIVVASGWAGAWAGAKVGGMAGAAIGSGEPGGGTAVGGLVGGFFGGIGGYMGARWVARKAYVTIRDWHKLPEVEVPQN
jgi:hypothetical protein